MCLFVGVGVPSWAVAAGAVGVAVGRAVEHTLGVRLQHSKAKACKLYGMQALDGKENSFHITGGLSSLIRSQCYVNKVSSLRHSSPSHTHMPLYFAGNGRMGKFRISLPRRGVRV